MIKAKAELELIEKEQKEEINRIIKRTQAAYDLAQSQEKNLNDLLTETNSQMIEKNEKFMQYSFMKRDLEMSRVLYDTLMQNIKQASATEQSQMVKIWVVKNADFPQQPTGKKKLKLLVRASFLVFSEGSAWPS